jgi:peptide-methionine (R)-S-oxide reductase
VISRRAFLGAGVAGAAAGFSAGCSLFRRSSGLPSAETGPQVELVQFDRSGKRTGIARVRKVAKTPPEWWAVLAPQQFYVTRLKHTDPPFRGRMFLSGEPGLYRCICCATALFSSDSKYNSGTGWPSFTAPVAMENVRRGEGDSLDSGIEVMCRGCDAHLGHIFGDGPPPAHLRWCINESALRFEPR